MKPSDIDMVEKMMLCIAAAMSAAGEPSCGVEIVVTCTRRRVSDAEAGCAAWRVKAAHRSNPSA
eukprot:3486195-Rhodomonas_salina.2